MGGEVNRLASQAVVGGAGGVESSGAKAVEGQLSVEEEVVPEVKGEVDVEGSDNRAEVVLEGTDMPFGGVCAVVSRGDVLYSRAWGKRLEEVSKEGRAFIVGDNVSYRVAVGSKESEGGSECLDVGFRSP